MRETAKYSFRTNFSNSESAQACFARISICVNSWLSEKTTSDLTPTSDCFTLHDGRIAQLNSQSLDVESRQLMSWTLQEPINTEPNSSLFRTSLSICRSSAIVAVSCTLEAGNPLNVVAPVTFEAFCPKVIRDIIDQNNGWSVEGTPIATKPISFSGTSEARHFWSIVSDIARALPIVVISEYDGRSIHHQLAARMARDLSGLAIVSKIDSSVSWEITNSEGSDWSCYNGAIRIYWPFGHTGKNPYLHPIWTTSRLLQFSNSAEEAATRIRKQIRRRVLGLSTLTVAEDEIFEATRDAYRAKQKERKRLDALTNEDWINELEIENETFSKKNRELNEQIAKLRSELFEAQALHAWQKTSNDEVEPITEDLQEATDAVKKAMTVFAEDITFGDDVLSSAANINSSKTNPNKIFSYLSALAELSKAKRAGSLGKTDIKWLNDRGFTTSSESETIKNSNNEMKKRTWHDGTGRRAFELHMKPTDATHPDGCVRIYFCWDKGTQKIIVGWVGRHPG